MPSAMPVQSFEPVGLCARDQAPFGIWLSRYVAPCAGRKGISTGAAVFQLQREILPPTGDCPSLVSNRNTNIFSCAVTRKLLLQTAQGQKNVHVAIFTTC
uniref:Uncharacterized protein n=1 Tax=Sphaerodactylus townsendi TaxID=933632 RepID=A0ACB8FPJ0_9SAUR